MGRSRIMQRLVHPRSGALSRPFAATGVTQLASLAAPWICGRRPSRSPARKAAAGIAAARCGLGLVAFVAPSLPARPWVGRSEASRPAVRLFARTLGARDLALGLGALLSTRHEGPMRGWVEAGGLADAGDSIATVLAFRDLPRRSRWLVLASTIGAAAAAGVLAPHVDRS